MFSVALLALLACEEELPPGSCENSELIETFVDADGDGFGDPSTRELVCTLSDGLVTNDDDCDDQRSQVFPGALEICDGIDNDCTDRVDDGLREREDYQDLDGDGFGNFDETTEACTPPPGYVENQLDCDDLNAQVNPAAREICNAGLDDNCNDKADDADPTLDRETATVWYYDLDDDGYGGLEALPFPPEAIERAQLTNPAQRCERPIKPPELSAFPGNFVSNVDDCDDMNPLVSPDGTEICNLIDDDCDQRIDDSDPDLDPSEKVTFWADDDRDGAGDASRPVEACFQPWFTATNDIDCDDADPLLQDATGWWIDGDGDGFGAGALSADSCTAPTADHVLPAIGEDCNDASLIEYPGAPEVCDALDNDCDTLVDLDDADLDVSSAEVVYRDRDGDGFGDPEQSTFACAGAVPPGFVLDNTDCDDRDRDIRPDAVEICDTIDNDCDQLVDSADLDVDLATAPEWWLDVDGDGWGNRDQSTIACEQPNLYVANDLDCDDGDDDIGPEIGWWLDADADGFGAGAVSAVSCDPPTVDHVPAIGDEDCDDTRNSVFPGAPDECDDGRDFDCNGVDAGPVPCVTDSCADADLVAAVTSFDVFVADLGQLAVDHTNFSCFDNANATGDAIFRVSAGVGEVVRARVEHPSDDVFVALLVDCSDGFTCQAGSNLVSVGNEQVEAYMDRAFEGYVVAGCRVPGGCDDALIEIEVLEAESWLADTCGDLGDTEVRGAGGYFLTGPFLGRDNLNMAANNTCTGFVTPGAEYFVSVTLDAGQRIEATLTTEADESIYLLETCGQANTCLVGADASGSAPETIRYTNNSGATEVLTLGLDCYSSDCEGFDAEIVIR